MATSGTKRGVTLVLQVILIVALSLLLVGILSFEMARTEAALRRETATVTALTRTVKATGYIFRDEAVVDSVDSGAVRYYVASGTTVTAGGDIALVYADGGNTGTRAAAAALTAEIERLQALDDASGIPDYYGAYEALMQSLSAGTVSGTDAAVGTLDAALDRYAAKETQASARAERIAALQAEFEKLVENDRNATDAVTAPASGVFVRETDGYEAVLSTAAVETLTPGGLRALLVSPQDTTLAIGKIMTGGTWYLAVPFVGAEAQVFEAGRAYSVTVDRTGETVSLLLERITAPDTAGEVLLIFRAEGVSLPADLARSQEITVSTDTVSGILVPMAALREEDGAYRVYVEENGVAVSRLVEPLLLQDGYCLVPATDRAGYLREGERILVTPRRIYNGKALS